MAVRNTAEAFRPDSMSGELKRSSPDASRRHVSMD